MHHTFAIHLPSVVCKFTGSKQLIGWFCIFLLLSLFPFRIMLIWKIYALNAVLLIFCQGICIFFHFFFSLHSLSELRTTNALNATSELRKIPKRATTTKIIQKHTHMLHKELQKATPFGLKAFVGRSVGWMVGWLAIASRRWRINHTNFAVLWIIQHRYAVLSIIYTMIVFCSRVFGWILW